MTSQAKSFYKGSFRDPSGFIFMKDCSLYRQVNFIYKENYDYLISSKLFEKLVDGNLLVDHKEVDQKYSPFPSCYKVLQPQSIPFVSYPYEWSFSQLKNAALTTLEIQKLSLQYGMTLKDGSAYNIQFYNGKSIFIDTLSFEKYQEGLPWVAYRQFCQHFFAPLALMAHVDVRLNQLMKCYIDGIPLDLASTLLPHTTYLNFAQLIHLHLHSKAQTHFSKGNTARSNAKISKHSLLGIVDSLQSAIMKLKCKEKGSFWTRYNEENNYSPLAAKDKGEIVSRLLDQIKPRLLFDFGANTGAFSRIACDKGITTVSFDMDPASVEYSYNECIARNETHLLPLVMDVSNPSPGIGWSNSERMNLIERGPADAVLMLALIHHLRIACNIPLRIIAQYFSMTGLFLIIEFIPKNDSQVQKLLLTRKDIFSDYSEEIFEYEFKIYFSILSKLKIKESERIIYLMKKNNDEEN
jgi:ribosomal protein L11 methylase PrmA